MNYLFTSISDKRKALERKELLINFECLNLSCFQHISHYHQIVCITNAIFVVFIAGDDGRGCFD